MYPQLVLELQGGVGGGVEPPSSFERHPPPSCGKFQPPQGGSLAHMTSLSMNDLLLIITRPPSTTMHCIPCVRSFGHLLVIKIHFSAKPSTKIRVFKIKRSKILEERALPPSTEGSRRVPSQSHIQHACLDSTFWPPTALDPRSCFWTIGALIKGIGVGKGRDGIAPLGPV